MQRAAKTVAVYLGLFLFTAGPVHVRASQKREDANFRVDLTYSRGGTAGNSSAKVKASDGTTLVISLVAYDPLHNSKPELAELVLRRNVAGNSASLFDPTNAHGMQRWSFAANDFARGPKGSVYGDDRTIDVPSVGLTFHVKVPEAAVRPFSTKGRATKRDYYFDYLKLEISVEKLVAK